MNSAPPKSIKINHPIDIDYNTVGFSKKKSTVFFYFKIHRKFK